MGIFFSVDFACKLARCIAFIAVILIVLKIFMAYWYVFVGLIAVGFVILLIKSPSTPKEPELVSITVVEKRTPSNPEELSKAQKLLSTFNESEKIVNESKNIETVDSRFNIMMSAGKELSNFTLAELTDFQRHFVNDLNPDDIFRAAAKRFIENQVAEISQLKTESAKNRRIEKVSDTIDGLHNMPPEIKTYARKLFRELLIQQKICEN